MATKEVSIGHTVSKGKRHGVVTDMTEEGPRVLFTKENGETESEICKAKDLKITGSASDGAEESSEEATNNLVESLMKF